MIEIRIIVSICMFLFSLILFVFIQNRGEKSAIGIIVSICVFLFSAFITSVLVIYVPIYYIAFLTWATEPENINLTANLTVAIVVTILVLLILYGFIRLFRRIRRIRRFRQRAKEKEN